MTLPDAIEAARAGKKSTIRCKAHNDGSASLSVAPKDGGGVLLYCHAGCTTEAVLSAAGLTWADICEDKAPKDSTPKTRQIVATYTYTGPNSEPLFQVVRYSPN